jgi:hypothetical protein
VETVAGRPAGVWRTTTNKIDRMIDMVVAAYDSVALVIVNGLSGN